MGRGPGLEPFPIDTRRVCQIARSEISAFPIHASRNLEEVVRGADVAVTVTPAREPLVKDEWIAPGTHIAALGADKGGDQELDSRILQRSRIFVDDIRQCRTDGEINVPLSKGLIREQDIAGEIGEVIACKKLGRRSDDEVTLFDSTGIALQDSATVPLEYERAVAAGVGVEKKMISTRRSGRSQPNEAGPSRPSMQRSKSSGFLNGGN